ncbi:MAG: SLC13 family permease [Mariprofundaceae bacterium]|nr:SLC13 family permease [Mariprofundaceae bacterium]
MRLLAQIGGPLIAVAITSSLNIAGYPHAPAMLGIAAWMAIWWISECVPIAFTALIPLVAFPLAGIVDGKTIAPRYVNSIIFLFIGGFLIAQALERTGLHKRLALALLSKLHAGPLQLASGFALVTAFLSMWISNTATTMLMVTIAVPLLARLAEEHGAETIRPVAITFLLTIAYAANIGGMGTPVGTAPNLVFLETISATAPDMAPSFLQWMMIGIPMVVAGLIVLMLFMRHRLSGINWQASDVDILKRDRAALGIMRREEKIVGWVLLMTALAWMSRKGIALESFTIPGWSSLLPYPGVDDGTVAIFGAAWLFLLRGSNKKPVLDTAAFGKLPWDIVLLLGGGFALAYGMQHSGASQWLGGQLGFLNGLPLPLMMLGIALAMTFLTEITSNTAITQVMLPILAAAALSNQMDLLMILLPATLSASCAFMLPVATPPNAIIFGTRQVPMQTMIRAGIRLNLTMAVVVVSVVWLIRPLLGIG